MPAACVALDLGRADAPQELLRQAGPVDILVNNAGAVPGGALDQVDDERWLAGWELKVHGYIRLARLYYPLMREAGAGVIANVIGMAGSAPRADLLRRGQCLADRLHPRAGRRGSAPRRARLRPESLAHAHRPRTHPGAPAPRRGGDASRWQETLSGLPFGRLMEPGEVADMLAFCASPRAGYLSGTVIDLDGGEQYAG